MSLAPGWERESADLYLHESGARISKTTYRGKMAWWFFPVSLDVPAVEYPPTDAGRDEALETSGRNLPKTRAASKTPRPAKKATREAAPARHGADPDESPADDSDAEADEEGEGEND